MESKQIKKITSMILSFFLFLCLFLMIALLSVKFTAFDKNFVLDKFEKNDYKSNTLSVIKNKMTALGIPGGIGEEIFEKALESEEVYQDINKYYENKFKGKEELTANRIKAKLKSELDNFFSINKIKLTDEEEQNVNTLIGYCGDEYLKCIDIPFIDEYIKVSNKLSDVFPVLFTILLIVTIGICFFIYIMQRWKHRFVRYITYAVTASSFMTILIPAFLLIFKTFDNISITPYYMYAIVIDIIKTTLFAVLVVGILAFLVSVLLFFIIRMMKKKI